MNANDKNQLCDAECNSSAQIKCKYLCLLCIITNLL